MAEERRPLAAVPSLIGKEVFLRPTVPEEYAATYHWTLQSEPQTLSARPLTIKTPAQAAESFKKWESSIDRQHFTVVRIEDKMPVGRISFYDYNPLNRSAGLGLIIDPEERRNSYGTEAMKLIIKYLFRNRGMNKVYAETSDFNAGTPALLESLGFKLDGRLRNHYFFNGEFHDRLIYSLLLYELSW